ncbi:MgtC/SapB family protein [Sphingomonas rhizophila]|uniref:Protein MgtC n=1 Tax=Sphingomonas rhizophila TaxID=2071607 RepID=A0A7G9SB95_9SPHN|nr:MgtC/SapB family protein [Sphingomonas rhizophila]QNN65120.1 MgtC/SapB family protein [Sphingomonas rhizophila]
MSDILGGQSFNVLPHLAALAIAYLLALPIGWNREQEERSAGLRTFPLVAVACCGLIQAAEGIAADNPEALARIIEGLITGMGFIGGGAILRKDDSVRGTATAASLWVTGAIGIAVGLGSYDVALMLTAATAITLWVLPPLKRLTK